jgi:dienelactone hydrolase
MNFGKYLITGFMTAMVFLAGFYLGHFLNLGEDAPLLSPFNAAEVTEPKKPLLKYTIANLAKRRYEPSEITIEETLAENPQYTSYLFAYQSLGKKITGQLNIPNSLLSAKIPEPAPVVIMLRGYADQEIYRTGVGTERAAEVFAQNGYITMAPDFLGFGGSDSEPADVWEARFIKPINVIELITSLKANPTLRATLLSEQVINLDSANIGIWAHSNGGQIALTVLEILGEPIPTTLWAPVTSPFPYSVLFFSDENEDEGQQARAWVAQFETIYDAREFSLTQHLDRLTGPIQLHHGTADEAAPLIWSNEFVQKVEAEQHRRENSDETELPAIDLDYYTYQGADHNLQPSWNTVVQRDLVFFNTQLTE